jgi:hypothetical protein
MNEDRQGKLFDIPEIAESEYGDFTNTIAGRFARFNANNPALLKVIEGIALDLRGRGFQHFGMKAIFERVRWLYAIKTVGDEYKLNNDFTALYARLLMDQHPSLKGFFRLRRLRKE